MKWLATASKQPGSCRAVSFCNRIYLQTVSEWVQTDDTLVIDGFALDLGVETLTRVLYANGEVVGMYWVIGQGKDLGKFIFSGDTEAIKKRIELWYWAQRATEG